MGAWFPKDKRGGIQTLEPLGKIQMSKGEPIKLSTTFLVLFTQSFITARNWLGWLLHGIGKVWQPKFELEKPSVFGKHILTPWASKDTKTEAIIPCFHVFDIILTIFLHVSSLKNSELPMCETIHIFGLPHDFGAPGIHHSRSLLCSSFCSWLGSVFVNA